MYTTLENGMTGRTESRLETSIGFRDGPTRGRMFSAYGGELSALCIGRNEMITYTTTHTKSGGRTDHQFYWNGKEVCRIYCNHCSQSAMMYFAGKSGPINYFMALEPGITAEHIDSAIRTPKNYAHYGYNADILEGFRNG